MLKRYDRKIRFLAINLKDVGGELFFGDGPKRGKVLQTQGDPSACQSVCLSVCLAVCPSIIHPKSPQDQVFCDFHEGPSNSNPTRLAQIRAIQTKPGWQTQILEQIMDF